MTEGADTMRNRRRELVAPGGSHDRLIRFLSRALPLAIGALAAILLLAPLLQRGEISFLLDRKKVDQTQERLRVDEARFRGIDNKGHPFSVTAEMAAQASASNPVVRMTKLSANIELGEGPASLTAAAGNYDYRSERIDIEGSVRFNAADGYRMVMDGVSVDLGRQTVTGSGGVSGEGPTGTFSADSLTADLDQRIIVLAGNARLRMTPGKLRISE